MEKTLIKSEYELQAEKFLSDNKTTFKVELKEHGLYFPNDKETRDIYLITLSREGKKPYSFRFGQSIAKSGTLKENYKLSQKAIREGKNYGFKTSDYERKREEPTAYDVLACLTKYEVGSFEQFCGDYGYDKDSRKAEETYIAVQKEFAEVKRLFGDVLEQLQEIN